MRTPVFIFASAAVLLMSVSQEVTAQSEPQRQATMKSLSQVELDRSAPLSASYKASTAALSFADENDATAYFGSISDNLVTFQPDFKGKTVTIHLQLRRAPAGWTTENWNNYIANKLTRN